MGGPSQDKTLSSKPSGTMSSLPHGWHGVLGPQKKPSSTNTVSDVTAVPNVRRKWNSSSTPDAYRSKLPSYKKPSKPVVENGYSNHMVPTRCKPNASLSNKIATSRYSSSAQRSTIRSGENSQAEIAKMKKDLASLKEENAILKARVRRVDDDNNQKARQIEKLQAEIKNDMMLKKKKESSLESLTKLRQKCLRLEGALKEKEAAMTKLLKEAKSLKMEELKGLVESYHKELGNNNNGFGSNTISKNHKILHSQCTGKTPPPLKQVRSGVRDTSANAEVTRLRDMLHKLQEENRTLQKQGKEKEQEIRRLKLQLQRQAPKIAPPSSTSASRLAPTSAKTRSVVATKQASDKAPTKEKQQFNPQIKVAKKQPIKTPDTEKLSYRQRIQQKQVRPIIQPTTKVNSTKPNPTFVVTKTRGQQKQKLSLSKQHKTGYFQMDADLESRVQDMRENVAARKIQRSWRQHRKSMLEKGGPTTEEEALVFIQTVLREHRFKKEKLQQLAAQEGELLQLTEEEKLAIVKDVQAAANKLWAEKLQNN